MSFSFKGEVPASKSLFNRALITQSYFPELKLLGNSNCDDVVYMKSGLAEMFSRSSQVYCGDGGTTFRFLALRASRESGEFLIAGTPRLLERPQDDLVDLLKVFGVKSELSPQGLKIQTTGWQEPHQPLLVDTSRSSQFASSLFLNAWNLPFDLEVEILGTLSESYLKLTLEFLESLGMQILKSGKKYRVPKNQTLKDFAYRVESDVSSCFSIAGLAAVAGRAQILNFPFTSQQPDLKFIDFLEEMGVTLQKTKTDLIIEGPQSLKPLKADLSQCPDLFPVLAMICAKAQGESYLGNAPQLVHKESNRIQKVSDLLTGVGIRHEILSDGMKIFGEGKSFADKSFDFDPDNDHRMVMAASVLNVLGAKVHILTPEVINKSYPDFLEVVRSSV